ncbi:hypothetical protein KJ940_18025, partial [Myxococcota bacterium]|nr:hypothetical protein [Myxococcota bacterium]
MKRRRLLILALLAACGAEDQDMAMGDGLRGTRDDPASYSVMTQAAQVCADGPTVYGIDVSKWQGDINWAAVPNDGVRYAIIRVSSGLNTLDEKFARNWAGARDVGLLRGAYQYFRPSQDAVDQAALFVRRIREEGGGMELPPVIDVETTDDRPAASVARSVRAWIDYVEREMGVRPMIYTGRYFWQDNVGNDPSFSDYLLWHPQYTSAQCPNIAEPWADWAFWQYSSTGRVSGISGDVDQNRFNGDEGDLAALIEGGASAYFGGQPRGQSFPLASEAPIELCVGESLAGEIRVDNIGRDAWDDQVRLAPTPRDVPSPIAAPSWLSPVRVTSPDGVVQPGEQGRFRFEIRGNTPGLVDQTFGLVAEGVTWFADQGGPSDDYLELVVNVRQCAPLDAGIEPDAAPRPDASVTQD